VACATVETDRGSEAHSLGEPRLRIAQNGSARAPFRFDVQNDRAGGACVVSRAFSPGGAQAVSSAAGSISWS
jgi:hypothetical protein